MTERWEQRLRDLRVDTPPDMWRRVQEGPRNEPSIGLPQRRQRVVTAGVALAIFVGAGLFAWQAFRPSATTVGSSSPTPSPGMAVYIDPLGWTAVYPSDWSVTTVQQTADGLGTGVTIANHGPADKIPVDDVVALTVTHPLGATPDPSAGSSSFPLSADDFGVSPGSSNASLLQFKIDGVSYLATLRAGAAARSSDLATMDEVIASIHPSATTSPQTATPTISSIAPAENGLIAFGCGAQICTATPDGSRLTNLTEGYDRALVAFSGTPVFSADGSRIAFVGVDQQGSSSGGGANYDVFVMNADGSDVANLTTSPQDVRSGDSQGSPTWSPDGSLIAYWNDSSDHAAQGVYVMNADGSDQHRISGGGSYFSWSPDRSRIVFSLNDGLWTVQPDGTGLIQVTQSSSYDQYPTWSPDGSRLAFVRDGAIYVVNADGTGLKGVAGVKGLEAFQPQWSPDGTQLAFEADDVSSDVYASDIYVVNVDGTGLKAIAHDPNLDENWPVWSPDGTLIAYAITDNLTPLNDGTWDLYVMRPDGSDWQRLTKDAHLGAEFDISWQRTFG